MSQSRTKNVSRNATVAVVCQIINLFLNFVIRTFFIKILGAEYLGVNGLFTNILTILSFAELGIGNAIVFSMYKPLATGNIDRIKSLMFLYKKAYNIIGITVGSIGLLLVPFLDYLIKGKPDIPESIPLLYVLFLANTVVSYFFAYKKNIIIADQKNHIVLVVSQAATIAKTIVQVGFLYITHAYIVYLIIQILFTILENIICSMIADKIYPYLKDKAAPLEQQDAKLIFRNVKALALYKFGTVILNGTDNILISAMVSVRDVGLASNYVLLTHSCNTILSRIVEVFNSSVGNLNATAGADKQYDIFKKLLFLTSWIYGYASIGLITVGQHFITVWIGEDYLMSYAVLLAIVIEFYVKGVHSICYTYRTTLGFFVEGRWSAAAAAIINLILSIILCYRFGVFGIFIATPISRILSVGVVDPILIFKKSFKRNPIEYYIYCSLYIVIFIAIAFLCDFCLSYITLDGWIGILFKIVIVTVIVNVVMILLFFRTKMFKEIMQMIMGVFRKRG